jgi:N-formylglutamate amidohydrolase
LQIGDNNPIDTPTNTPPAFSLLQPEQQMVPFLFNSPHSGRYYPQSFIDASQLDPHMIRQSEDFLVDEIFASVVELGIPMLHANYARAYLDVNREPYELDANMFAGELPDFVNTNSVRVAGGLGTVARIVAEGQEIYRDKLVVAEVLDRVKNLYQPYHQALRNILAKTHVAFGYCVLVDCHSMPSVRHDTRRNVRPDIIVGDRYGTSANREIVNSAMQILRDLGYDVAINKPYAGGFITEHYGRPKEGMHALQIEINRSIYMDEKAMVPNSGFDRVREDLAVFAARLVVASDGNAEDQYSAAAE